VEINGEAQNRLSLDEHLLEAKLVEIAPLI